MTSLNDLTADELTAASRTAGSSSQVVVASAVEVDDLLNLPGDETARVVKMTIRSDGLLALNPAVGWALAHDGRSNRRLPCPPSYRVERLSTKGERDA